DFDPNSRKPDKTENVKTIDFDWEHGSPSGISADRFFARFRKTMTFPKGYYKIELTSDDGSKLLIDGEVVIDMWQLQSEKSSIIDFFSDGEEHQYELLYFENAGKASLKLSFY